jgi:ribokinase
VLFKGANHAITDPPPPSLFTSPTGPTHLVLQNEIPLPDTLAHLALAHAAGATTFFNPSPLPSDKELQTIEWAHIRWLVLNADEAASLLSALGEPFTDAPPVPKLPSTAAPALFASYAVAASLHAHPRLARATGIVCTLGASGALALAPSLAQPVYVPGVLLPDGPVDTTGAGDCFTGYLVAGLMDLHTKGTALDEHTLRAVLTRCVRAAGMCCERRGAMESIPSAMEVDKRFGVET